MERESEEFVQAVRDALWPGNNPVNDPQKAFQLTQHVAWQLQDLGYGLVKAKQGSSNNIQGYTSGVIARPDGYHVDISIDEGGDTFAAWQPNTDPGNMAAIKPRWSKPIDVGDVFHGKPPVEEGGEDGEGNGEEKPPEFDKAKLRLLIRQEVKNIFENHKIAITNCRGLNVTSDADDHEILKGNRPWIQAWEEFTIHILKLLE